MSEDESAPMVVDVDRLREAVKKVRARSKIALLRQILPELELKEREGATAADLVAAMSEVGLQMSIGTFWKYRSRLRAEGRRGSKGRLEAPEGSKSSAVERSSSASSNDMVNDAPTDDYERTAAMLDKKKRDDFATQFMEAEKPLKRWLRRTGRSEE
ncbi:hypothetical protein IY145_23400 [Methylosinus sp. H3A]|uniref:hypothetical protein n=1 Tax=Methylosinus sp. H3A TaxID=2785786 RepID=UPI0018C2D67E|nr:hypothetical protein [Methylosinus sp. H3A]MBG0812295.1 hypothetical protein [Methylosinus sp. H3A]